MSNSSVDSRTRGRSEPGATNTDEATVNSFGEQWTRFDQAALADGELRMLFDDYFRIFPWEVLTGECRGADIGCGSGRWARFVADRVGELHCVDPSGDALEVAARNLSAFSNVQFHRAGVGELPFGESSLDFAYSLGVLHHVPDTSAAVKSIARTLKRGAPLLLYLYYAFDNRPAWYRLIWKSSDAVRRVVAFLPPRAKSVLCDAIAVLVYWPLARCARVVSAMGGDVSSFPLALYRDRSLYSMRTDARDRFGTPLEQRFRADAIRQMMTEAGLTNIRVSDLPPYWCAVGSKA